MPGAGPLSLSLIIIRRMRRDRRISLRENKSFFDHHVDDSSDAVRERLLEHVMSVFPSSLVLSFLTHFNWPGKIYFYQNPFLLWKWKEMKKQEAPDTRQECNYSSPEAAWRSASQERRDVTVKIQVKENKSERKEPWKNPKKKNLDMKWQKMTTVLSFLVGCTLCLRLDMITHSLFLWEDREGNCVSLVPSCPSPSYLLLSHRKICRLNSSLIPVDSLAVVSSSCSVEVPDDTPLPSR